MINGRFASAEREGFEPPVPVTAQQFSRLLYSTALPSLQIFYFFYRHTNVKLFLTGWSPKTIFYLG